MYCGAVAAAHKKVSDFGSYIDFLDFLRSSQRPLTVSFETVVSDSPDAAAASVTEKLDAFVDGCKVALSREPAVEFDELRAYSRLGLPEKLRAQCWKLLLGYLPPDRARWDSELARQHALYQAYLDDFLPKDASSRPRRLEGHAWFENGPTGQPRPPPPEPEGDPLMKPAVVSDSVLLDEDIWKDVQRTHPGLHFFSGDTPERMRRILFVYAKLNPGIGYVQGMNEILAVIIYVLGKSDAAEAAEPDAFFCFSLLMAEVRDLFIRDLDSEETGIQGNIARLDKLIKEQDPEVSMHLSRLQIHTQYFAFRWLTTLLTREFELPESIRFWDSLLAAVNRLAFLHRACCALVTTQRDLLLHSDFPSSLKALQRTSPVPVEVLLREVDAISRAEMHRATHPSPSRFASDLNLSELVQAGISTVQRAIESVAAETRRL